MNIERMIERIKDREYQSVGQQVGREAVAQNFEELRLLRSALAKLAPVEGLYASGYRAALDDVLSGVLITQKGEQIS